MAQDEPRLKVSQCAFRLYVFERSLVASLFSLSPVSLLLPLLFLILPVLCPALHPQCRHRRGLKPLTALTQNEKYCPMAIDHPLTKKPPPKHKKPPPKHKKTPPNTKKKHHQNTRKKHNQNTKKKTQPKLFAVFLRRMTAVLNSVLLC